MFAHSKAYMWQRRIFTPFHKAKNAGAFKAPAPNRLAPTRSDAFSSTSASSFSSTVLLTRFLMSLRSDSSSTNTMFTDTARALFVNDSLFSREKSFGGARAVIRRVVVNLRKRLCVTLSEAQRNLNGQNKTASSDLAGNDGIKFNGQTQFIMEDGR